LFQAPLSELEIHLLWEPVGVCAQRLSKLPTGVEKKMLVSMHHYIYKNIFKIFFLKVDVFIILDTGDQSILNLPAVVQNS
jgi:ABC-type long-subunit fatty acid transport system fused permease/ATPase subunit